MDIVSEVTITKENGEVDVVIPKKVIIDKEEYERLVEDSEFLKYLEKCGINNWKGYNNAIEMSLDKES
ncbi:unnamed protein product [marine sediment metagenome]|uniref:Uncharacterized protein n=1 Tax=marine sediment metagenome TaxID=412755 RepID=X0X4F5_9ZZZZ